MKKVLILLVSILFVLAACGGENNSNAEINNSETNNTETNEVEDNVEDNVNAEEINSEADKDDENLVTEGGAKVGDTIDNEIGAITLVSLNNDIDSFETGPFVTNINKVNGVHAELSDQEMIDLFEGQEELEYIQIDLEVENTKEEKAKFFIDQMTMTTNTGEQIEADWIFSDSINGEFMDKITQSGSLYFFLENSKAEDVEKIKLFIDGPSDDNFENIGEDVQLEIELNK